ncbi:MAG: FKBP-type peptidyl-prolyl cis-trans isomerase [Bacteroidales bacterium]|nr:FKBP-type peptidyl-prolyl cis-trans isomerase [Bacteroidales bacterium]
MRKIFLPAAVALLLASCAGNSTSAPLKEAPVLKNAADTLSWAYGQNLAEALRQGFFAELDADLILQSARYALDGGEQPLSPDEKKAAVDFVISMYNASIQRMMQSQQSQVDSLQAAYFANLEKTNPNVHRDPTGFYYEVLREGTGPKATYAQRVEFDYRSFLMLTGEPYDQTYGKREPIMHVIGEPMFPGLIKAFQHMNTGSIYRFYFPYQLAFGTGGSGDIPGYTPFIYEIELHGHYND